MVLLSYDIYSIYFLGYLPSFRKYTLPVPYKQSDINDISGTSIFLKAKKLLMYSLFRLVYCGINFGNLANYNLFIKSRFAHIVVSTELCG